MLIKEIVRLAESNALKPVSIKNKDDIIDYINLGMIELAKRFNLYSKEYIIDRVTDTTIYDMPEDYMTLQAAYTSDGDELFINDSRTDMFINTISPFKVQIPMKLKASKISILYASTHKWVTDLDEEVAVPYGLLEALMHYIAFQAKSSVDASTNKENNAHWLRFEASCENALNFGVVYHNPVEHKGLGGFA